MQDRGVADTGKRDLGSWVVPEFRTVLRRCLAWAITGRFDAAVKAAASPSN
jgi:hypothetical protein